MPVLAALAPAAQERGMSNFRWLKFFNTTPLLIALNRHRERFAGEGPVQRLDTIPSDPPAQAEVNMIRRLRHTLIEDMNANKVMLHLAEGQTFWYERLNAESVTDWRQSEPGPVKALTLCLPLETNPGVSLIVGADRVHMEVGTLWWFETRLHHSFMNYGAFPAIHLLAQFNLAEAS
jgi:hypothetical protein